MGGGWNDTISQKVQLREAVDILVDNALLSIQKGRWTNASILHEMPYQKGNERRQGHNHEEWETGNPRRVSRVRHQDVQNREELSWHQNINI